MTKIVQARTEEYIRALLPEREPLLAKIEQEAAEKIVPIVEPEVAHFLYWLALSYKSKKVLEVGTAIGYSAITLAKAVLPLGGSITTLEINKPRYLAAQENFKLAGLEKKINLIYGDARELIFQMDDQYDFIFLDAAKGKYPEFLEKCIQMLTPGGILVADDVLLHGMVVSGEVDKRRNKTVVRRLQDYLKKVMNHPQLETIIFPMGDGVAVSYKKILP